MTSGLTFAFIHVEVVATSPSTSHWFEYSRNRIIDIWSSGSLAMSVRTTMRGRATYGSTYAEVGGAAWPVVAATRPAAAVARNASGRIVMAWLRVLVTIASRCGRNHAPAAKHSPFSEVRLRYAGPTRDGAHPFRGVPARPRALR